MDKKFLKGYIFVILSAVIYGLMPLMARFIYNDGVTPFSLVLLRTSFAVLIILITAKITGVSLKVNRKLLPGICLTGLLGSCITPLLLYI